MLPVPLLTVKLTVYVPASGYVYSGLCTLDVLPSPNIHSHDVTGPVDAFVNCTASGLLPDTGLPVKNAITGSGGVVVVLVMENPLVKIADCPSALITVTFHAPVTEPKTNWQVILDVETKLTLDPVIVVVPLTSLTIAPVRKFVPVNVVIFTVAPAMPELGVMPVTVGAARGAVVAITVVAVVTGIVVGVTTGTADIEETWVTFAG